LDDIIMLIFPGNWPSATLPQMEASADFTTCPTGGSWAARE